MYMAALLVKWEPNLYDTNQQETSHPTKNKSSPAQAETNVQEAIGTKQNASKVEGIS